MKLKYVTSLIISVSFLGQQYAFAQMQPPAQPVYETCQQVEVQNGDNGTYMQTDQACVNRNGIKSRDYNAAVQAYNRGTQIISSDSKSMAEPTKPTYESCAVVGGDHGNNTDYACTARNQAKEREYNLQMSGYNEAKTQEAKAKGEAQTAEQARLTKLEQEKSAQKAMEEAEQKNKKGSAIYQIASIACGVASAVYAGQFAASCAPVGGCQFPLLAKSIAFAIFSGMAAKQASSHDSVAHNACQAANKMASSPTDCGPVPAPPPSPDTFPSTQVGGVTGVFDNNGRCISTPERCAGIISTLPPGVNIKDAMKGVTSFASGKVPFKVNADGSVTGKNGKKFTAANFASEKDMVAAGLSASEAKSLMGDLNRANMSSALNAKAELDKENKQDLGSFADISGAGGGAKGTGVANNGNAKGSSDTNGGKREPASAEGLAKDFNGELIGVAGDDIFKMMNRRYKLKTAQDSFIGP